MPMYNLIEYSDNYFKISGSLWHYRDESFLNANGAIADLPADNNNNVSSKFKKRTSGRTKNNRTKDVKII